MERRSHVPVAVAMLALPALVFAWAAAEMLANDISILSARSAQKDAVLVESRVSAGFSSCVDRAKHAAEAAVASVAANPTATALAELSSREPYVRNAFRWVSGKGVVFPVERGATQEERRFLARYVTLFDEGFKGAGRDFVWKSWFEGDRLSFVGWRRAADGSVVGAELETVAFLAEFPSVLSGVAGEGFAIEVRDGSGGALFKVGAVPEKKKPDAVFSLSSVLPHRTLALWQTRPLDSAVDGLGALAVSVVAGTVLFLLLASGALILVLAARRERCESEKKTSFVSNVSHELKTPLTSIRLCAEMLAEGRAKDDAAKTRYLGTIARESERLTRLVDNVLDFGRLEQNRRRYDLAHVDLREVVREAAESQRSRVEAAGMALSVEAAEKPAIRLVDRDAVSQIVVNLVDNAAKYAAEGGRIDVKVDADGAVVVADRGPGIPKRDMERVFDRFYRCDDSLAAKSSGSGLGLSIARRLAEGMGGTLVCAERKGGGAEFILKFGGCQ
jgi:signal transduction histidine kinase